MSLKRGPKRGPKHGLPLTQEEIDSLPISVFVPGSRDSRVNREGESPPRNLPEKDNQPERGPLKGKVALIGGIHPNADSSDWTVVGRHGRPLSFNSLRYARLHPFTEAGVETARRDGRELRDAFGYDTNWTVFVARVVVEGSLEEPTEVTPAWVVEGRERPVDVGNPFESRERRAEEPTTPRRQVRRRRT